MAALSTAPPRPFVLDGNSRYERIPKNFLPLSVSVSFFSSLFSGWLQIVSAANLLLAHYYANYGLHTETSLIFLDIPRDDRESIARVCQR